VAVKSRALCSGAHGNWNIPYPNPKSRGFRLKYVSDDTLNFPTSWEITGVPQNCGGKSWGLGIHSSGLQ
jgi:hypothetical protein